MMYLWISYKKNLREKFFASLKALKKLVGSGLDPELNLDPLVRGTEPDPHQNVTGSQQNVMNPQHC
jgi:hypothetical protein